MTAKRRFQRQTLRNLVYVDIDGSNGAIALNLSENGVEVHAVAPLGLKQSVRCGLQLGDDKLDVNGVVVWSDPSGRAGVKFNTTAEHRQTIKDFLLSNTLAAAVEAEATFKPPQFIAGGEGPDPLRFARHVRGAAAPAQAPVTRPVALPTALPAPETAPLPVPAFAIDLPGYRQLALHELAQRAQQGTRATGAALAMLEGGAMTCCARSGGTAPDIGARLDSAASFSGQCIQSGTALRCDDSETDARVDAAVCRSLGVRSIVAAPVKSAGQVIGVFEIFSDLPFAFRKAESDLIEQLAELAAMVATANAPPPAEPPAVIPTATAPPAPVTMPKPEPKFEPRVESKPELKPEPKKEIRLAPRLVEPPAPRPVKTTPPPPAARDLSKLEPPPAEERVHTALQVAPPIRPAVTVPVMARMKAAEETAVTALKTGQAEQRTQTMKLAALIVLTLVAVSAAGFQGWRFLNANPSAEVAAPKAPATERAATPGVPPASNAAIGSAPSTSPAASTPAPRATPNAAPNPAASKTAPDTTAPVARAPQPVATLQPSQPRDVEPAATAAPSLSDVTTQRGIPAVALLSTPRLPTLSAPAPTVSSRSGGDIITQTKPTYPSEARRLGIEGDVTLDVLVGRDGKVRNVKVVKGVPSLNFAAVAAVQQWRYSPLLVNGVATENTAQVTVQFKLSSSNQTR